MDPHGQVGYYIECLLGGYHGLDVSDLIRGLRPANTASVLPGNLMLSRRLAEAADGERERFQRATSLDEARYANAFGDQAHPALEALIASHSA